MKPLGIWLAAVGGAFLELSNTSAYPDVVDTLFVYVSEVVLFAEAVVFEKSGFVLFSAGFDMNRHFGF
jgi:hypothetical protein